MTDWEKAIHVIRQEADDMPNSIDYPVSNMLTLIENLMSGAVPDDLASEIQASTKEMLRKLFEEASG